MAVNTGGEGQDKVYTVGSAYSYIHIPATEPATDLFNKQADKGSYFLFVFFFFNLVTFI